MILFSEVQFLQPRRCERADGTLPWETQVIPGRPVVNPGLLMTLNESEHLLIPHFLICKMGMMLASP